MADAIHRTASTVELESMPTLQAPVAVRSGASQPFPQLDVLPSSRPPVTVVTPCFNEEESLDLLFSRLERFERQLAPRYDLTFVLVDDASRDGTWDGIQRRSGSRENFRSIRHDTNCGIAAAILTGIRHARTEIVCSIDADCSYDPLELARMIPLLEEGVDLVTASPYHPQGEVANVSAWRLWLSLASSRLYRSVLRTQLHTYTSCCRVYRRSAVRDLALRNHGFVGVAELLCRLDERGARIVESPARLEMRQYGQSKMRLLSATIGHLRLIGELACARLARRSSPQNTDDSPLPGRSVQKIRSQESHR